MADWKHEKCMFCHFACKSDSELQGSKKGDILVCREAPPATQERVENSGSYPTVTRQIACSKYREAHKAS